MADIRRFLTDLGPAEIGALSVTHVVDAAGRRTSLAELLAGWSGHVQRFEEQLPLPWDDRNAWTEHDLVGALHLRDRLAGAIALAPAEVQKIAQPALAQIDDRFLAYTEPDNLKLLERVIPAEPIGHGWWWNRVPKAGPVLDGLMRLLE